MTRVPSAAARCSMATPRQVTVAPWEQNMVKAVEKAITSSDLGLNPSTSGNLIRVPLPPLTEERRRDLIRVVRHEAEQARVAIRNIRRDANSELKEAVKEKLISEDGERRGLEGVQQLTDDAIEDLDKVLEEKEKDLMAL